MRKKILWMLLLIPLVASMAIMDVSAPPPTYLYVDPPIIWDQTMEEGTEFSVDIKVSYVTKRQSLWAYQVELSFNPDVIHGVSYENGPFMGSKGGVVGFIPGKGFDNEVGTLALFAGYISSGNLPYGIDGILATVTFEVVGTGNSGIILSEYSILVNIRGAVIPAEPSEHGFFSNAPGPELYVRRRGAHGGGAWPEWHVGLYTEDQTLYSRIMNYGEMGAYVEVRFEVSAAGLPTHMYVSDQVWIDAATWVADEIVPGEVVVSAEFPTGTPGVFTVNAKLYFKVDGMTQKIFYGELVELLGGEAVTRDIATKYKVVAE